MNTEVCCGNRGLLVVVVEQATKAFMVEFHQGIGPEVKEFAKVMEATRTEYKAIVSSFGLEVVEMEKEKSDTNVRLSPAAC